MRHLDQFGRHCQPRGWAEPPATPCRPCLQARTTWGLFWVRGLWPLWDRSLKGSDSLSQPLCSWTSPFSFQTSLPLVFQQVALHPAENSQGFTKTMRMLQFVPLLSPLLSQMSSPAVTSSLPCLFRLPLLASVLKIKPCLKGTSKLLIATSNTLVFLMLPFPDFKCNAFS